MTRLPYRTAVELPEPARTVLEALAAERGYVPNLYAALANAPRFLPDFVQGGATARGEGALPPRLREVAILRIAALTASETMRVSHLPLAAAAGLDPEAIAALEDANMPLADAHEHAVATFAAELTGTVRVTPETWGAAAAFLDAEQLAELVYICAFYNLVARVLGALEIDLDPHYQAPPPM